MAKLQMLKRAAVAVIEQGVYALQNFMITAIGATFLSERSFAELVPQLTCVTFGFSLASTFLSTPAQVFLEKQYRETAPSYLLALLLVALAMGIPVLAILCMAFSLLSIPLSISGIGSSLLMFLGTTVYDLHRRSRFSSGRTTELLIHGLIAIGTSLGVCGALIYHQQLDKELLQLAFSVPLLLVVLATTAQKSKQLASEGLQFRSVIVSHWRFSKYLLVGMILYSVSTQGVIFVSSCMLSDADIGGLRTAQTLASVLNLSFVVYDNQFTPRISSMMVEKSQLSVINWVRSATIKISLGLIPLCLALVPVLYVAHQILFGKNYGDYSSLVWIFVLYLYFLGLTRPSFVGFKVIENNRPFMIGYLLSAIAAMVLVFPLLYLLGVYGAALALTISPAILLIVLLLSVAKEKEKIAQNDSIAAGATAT